MYQKACYNLLSGTFARLPVSLPQWLATQPLTSRKTSGLTG
jgi:hypothetical protein